MFNAARLLLEQCGPVTSGWIQDLDPTTTHPGVTLIKLHEFDADLAKIADVVLTSRRHLVNIAASVERMGWTTSESESLGFLDSAVAQHQHWAPFSSFEMTYESLKTNTATQVIEIGKTLGLEVTTENAEQIAKDIKQLGTYTGPPGTYDTKSLLHPEHIGESPADLTADHRLAIETRFNYWLVANGYPTPPRPAAS